MIMDTNTTFASALEVKAAAGTALIGDVVDMTASAVNPARGEPLLLVLRVTTAFTSGGAATVQFILASDAAAAIAADGSETRHYTSDVFALTQLTTSLELIIPLPQGITYERYLGIEVITAVATTTAGNISAFLVKDAQNYYAYPDATN